MNSQNPTNLGFFQEVLSYVDEFQLNKLDVALSKKKTPPPKMPFDSHMKKKHSGKQSNKARPLNAWMVGSDDEAFLPSFLGSLNGLFSRGKLASGL